MLFSFVKPLYVLLRFSFVIIFSRLCMIEDSKKNLVTASNTVISLMFSVLGHSESSLLIIISLPLIRNEGIEQLWIQLSNHNLSLSVSGLFLSWFRTLRGIRSVPRASLFDSLFIVFSISHLKLNALLFSIFTIWSCYWNTFSWCFFIALFIRSFYII